MECTIQKTYKCKSSDSNMHRHWENWYTGGFTKHKSEENCMKFAFDTCKKIHKQYPGSNKPSDKQAEWFCKTGVMFAWNYQDKLKCHYCIMEKHGNVGKELYNLKDGKKDERYKLYRCKAQCYTKGGCPTKPNN